MEARIVQDVQEPKCIFKMQKHLKEGEVSNVYERNFPKEYSGEKRRELRKGEAIRQKDPW